MLSFIPLPYRILIGVAIVAGAFGFGVYGGHHYAWLQEEAAVAAAETKVIADVAVQDTATEKAGEAAAVKQAEIQVVYRTITKEVKVYVTKKADAACVVPVGFVRVWNAAATGVEPVPGPAGQSNDAPSGVGISTVADTGVANFEKYRAVAQQLIDLQDWVRDAQARAAAR